MISHTVAPRGYLKLSIHRDKIAFPYTLNRYRTINLKEHVECLKDYKIQYGSSSRLAQVINAWG